MIRLGSIRTEESYLKARTMVIVLLLLFVGSVQSPAGIFTVNTTNDTHAANFLTGADGSGNISLRSAIEAANSQLSLPLLPHIINVPPGTYNLTLGSDIIIGSATAHGFTIHGQGTPLNTNIAQTIAANGCFENFYPDTGQTITIENVKITGGNAGGFGGGAILAGGPSNVFNVTNCDLSGNSTQSTDNGGAISFSGGGDLNCTNSTFSNDTARSAVGGAIAYNNGTNPGNLKIDSCIFTMNLATAGAGAGQGGAIMIVLASGNRADITNCTFVKNAAGTPISEGGAVYVSSGIVNISLCRFSENIAAAAGSALYNNSGTVTAKNNWWGCDAPPGSAGCQTTSGTVDADPRIDLQLSAAPSLILPGGSSLLTASFAKNSNNTPINPTVMNGLTITFNGGAHGSVSPTTATITNLTANSTYTNATCPGDTPTAVSGKVDNGTQTAGITVHEPPRLGPCPANISKDNDSGHCSAVVAFTPPTAIKGCPPPAIVCTPPSGTAFSKGTTLVNCVASNGVAPNDTCRFTVSVADTEHPVMHCPGTITQANDPGKCTAVVVLDTNIATDNCPGVRLLCKPPSGSTFQKGATQVTCTATDAGGLSSACSFTVTVQDTERPVVTCPANIAMDNDRGLCSAIVNYQTPTATDNCPGTIAISCKPTSGSPFPVGSTTVNCMATDSAGKVGTCSFTVTVADTEKPKGACPHDTTVAENPPQSGHATVNYPDPTVHDNCPNPTFACTPPSGSSFSSGTTEVKCLFTDAHLNKDSCSFKVTVTQTCQITCRRDTTVSNDHGQCGAIVSYADPATTGACGTVTCSPASGSSFPVGTTTVRCTSLTTGSFCEFKVTVQDTAKPVVACPQNITVDNIRGQCAAVVNYTAPAAADNCPGATVVCTPPSGATFAKGSTTVKCVATDAHANKDSCMFTVTVRDTEKPVLACPADIVQQTDPHQCSAAVIFKVHATDNCPGVTLVSTPSSGSTFNKGKTTVKSIATDASGNKDSCTFTVTVADIENPAIACQPDTTVKTDSGSCAAVVSFPLPHVSDNCPGVGTAACVPPSGSTFPKGTTVVTCKVSDALGNKDSCKFQITVEDHEVPKIACQSDTSVVGQTCTLVNYPTPTATDNCGTISSIVCNPPSGTCFPVGKTTVTCTAYDGSGNKDSCKFHVTVVPCTITCPKDTSLANEQGLCGAHVTFAPTTTAGCGTVSCTPASGSLFPVGATPVVCSAEAGPQCRFTVTVADTQKPGITCPPNVTVSSDPGVCQAVVNYVAQASDNCPGVTVICTPPSGSAFPVGTTPVKCKAIDASGNKDSCSFSVTVTQYAAAALRDDFNRPNGPLAGSNQWANILNHPSNGSMAIVGADIQATSSAGNFNFGGVVWDSLVNSGSEACLTLERKSGNGGYTTLFIYAKMNNKDYNTGTGYRLRYQELSGTDLLEIHRVGPGYATFALLASANIELHPKDIICFRILCDNKTMIGLVNGAPVIQAVDATYMPAPWYYALRGCVFPTTALFDSFQITPKPPAVPGCPAISIAPSTLPAGVTGVPYDQSVVASGGTSPYTYAVTSGSLPAGLTLKADSGKIRGTPTTPGSSNFVITATDAQGCKGSQSYTIAVTCPTISLLPTSLPAGSTGTPYSQTIVASGGAAPYVYKVTTGTLPPGLSLDSLSGALTGGPTQGGSFTFTITARDTNRCTGQRSYTIVITCPVIAGVLRDNFNRANSPLSGTQKWTNILNQPGSGSMAVVGNAIQSTNTGGNFQFGGVVWDSLVGGGTEASVTLVQKSGNFSFTSLFIYARMNSKDYNTGTGYRLRYFEQSGTDILEIHRVGPGYPNSALLASAAKEVSVGDVITFRILCDNKTMIGLVNGVQILQATDATYLPAQWMFALRSCVFPTPARFDDFKISPPPGPAALSQTPIEDVRNLTVKEYDLSQNYPNPFNPTTQIGYALPAVSRVVLKIYNVLGEAIAVPVNGLQPAGHNAVDWNASGFASGIYFYRLEATSAADPGKTYIRIRKMLFLK
ncbi:MAG TPA: HYR domain-containing protein [Bacteroidota bacterium]|nr:HYR domain-containing protein [Bacteroidota bacterium]